MRAIILSLALATTLSAAPESELIYTDAPFPSAHASTVMETADGDILASWFGGSDEGEPDVAIYTARMTDGKWSAPVEVARHENTPTWNPVLFRTQDADTGDDTVWLFYKFGDSPRTWTGAYMSSKDDGRTWSESTVLPTGILGPVRAKPLILPDGTIIAGSSHESYHSWTSYAEVTKDPAGVWARSNPIVIPDHPYGSIQPTIVPFAGGVRMFVRTRGKGKIGVSESYDGGRNWTPIRMTDLPNPNAGVDAVRLQDGRLVLIYNHTPKGRSPLNLAVSKDDGETWTSFLALEVQDGEYSYPAIIQHSDGSLHMTYTFKRETIKHVRVPLDEIPD